MPRVDVHTHLYPPALMAMFRERNQVPYVRRFADDGGGERLVILPAEEAAGSTARGRPIGREYYDARAKVAFMDAHGIDVSVVSLANPWLDWVARGEAGAAARRVNDEVERMCGAHEGRLYAFAALPWSGGAGAVVAEVGRLGALAHCRGVVMGTSGLGAGLDAPALDPVWQALATRRTLVFLHPHYGLPREALGPRTADYGHVLPLAVGFPLETTVAVTRMILAGVFDRFPDLQVLLAHSGGTLPFLAGRIESCLAHDAHLRKERQVEGRRGVWEILKENIYLDAVIYSEVGLKAAIDASGADRIMFGTDHPFFPPPDDDEGGGGGGGGDRWPSVTSNISAIHSALGSDSKPARDIMGDNAARILRLRP